MLARIPLLLAALVAGCGGGAAYYGAETAEAPTAGPGGGYGGDYDSYDEGGGVALEMAAEPEEPSSGAGWDAFDDREREVAMRSEMESRAQLMAQARPQRRQPPTPPQTTPQTRPEQPDETETATDETRGPLLIYEAILNLAVYQVEENQRSVAQVAEELGGFLSRQDDTTIVIRVPASKFAEAVSRIEALGDVLHRNVQALDVSEEFRDAQIRLRNAEQVRDRLAALLQQARNVEESLQIERELERLTREIELIKGRLRFLEDRIAYSTITVNFSPKEEESLEGEIFHLPFDWLYDLGLRRLMNLR